MFSSWIAPWNTSNEKNAVSASETSTIEENNHMVEDEPNNKLFRLPLQF
jgi:hypothetical protein